MKEKWKPIKGYEGLYAVSDQGRVKRVAHMRDNGHGSLRHINETILKVTDVGGVNLCKDGQYIFLHVRSLVAEAFKHIPYGDDVTHLNGDSTDARVENIVSTSEFRKMDDNWRDIPGWEGLYQASRFGEIRSLDRYMNSKGGGLKFCQGRVKVLDVSSDEYYQATLYRNGRSETRNAHVYVARAWIPNPDGKLTVNHIDGNKQNNNIENLEWATYAEQQEHAVRTGLRKKSYWSLEVNGPVGGNSNEERKIRVRCIETGVEYESYSEAGRQTGTSASEIKRSTDDHVICGGFHYVRADEKDYSWGVEDLKDEVWYDIPEYKGLYQISNKDRIKSMSRTVVHTKGRMKGKTRCIPERLLTPSGDKQVYTLAKGEHSRQLPLSKWKQITFPKSSTLFSIN